MEVPGLKRAPTHPRAVVPVNLILENSTEYRVTEYQISFYTPRILFRNTKCLKEVVRVYSGTLRLSTKSAVCEFPLEEQFAVDQRYKRFLWGNSRGGHTRGVVQLSKEDVFRRLRS